MTHGTTRRSFLARSAAMVGCSVASSPFLSRVSLAAAPWEQRLVVIILRGGMDGLDVVQPYGAPELAALRPDFAIGPGAGAPDLDGFFALHPALAGLMPLWSAQQLGFVHAVSTPYRDKRSHFDGQDLLEAGTVELNARRDGWLNRALAQLPGVETETAYAVGHGDMKVLHGAAPVADWAPEIGMDLSPQALLLAERVMEDDPAFHAAFSEAQTILSSFEPGMDAGGGGHLGVAEFVAGRLRRDTRIAAFSLNGWDTHSRQAGPMTRALNRLSETILTLQARLGPDVWGQTAVVAMTEFGRTVRQNGTQGTDHGTGGAMLLAGGAVRGGRVHGRWPGLAEADLYDRRDLMPTADVRAQAAWMLRGLTGIDRAVLEDVVFPGLDMGHDPGLLT